MYDHQVRDDHQVRSENNAGSDNKGRYDNKVRLSADVLAKAEMIAQEWGLKNARAAVEAVFRKYSDTYLHGHSRDVGTTITLVAANPHRYAPEGLTAHPPCAALDELDDLLSF